MQHLDEGTIHTWLDGALSPEEAASAEAHVASCARCADAVAEARGLIAASSRILTALDHVPSVRVSPGRHRAPPSLTTWLVREKIAAVMTLVVAGGALALVLARNTPEATQADLETVPLAMEVVAADSSAPAAVAPLQDEVLVEPQATSTRPAGRAPSAPLPTVASNREGDSSAVSLLQQGPATVAEGGRTTATRTDDSVRSVTVATAQRAEARESVERSSSAVAEKAVGEVARRRAADASARYTRPAAPAVGGAAGASRLADGPRLVHDERMTEEGREVRRRIYRVDGVLVTLDQRQPGDRDMAARAPIANTPPADTTVLPAMIRWTDAKGAEFTLTGPAPRERLEQIRTLICLNAC